MQSHARTLRVKTEAATERGGVSRPQCRGEQFRPPVLHFGIRAASMMQVRDNMVLVPRASLARSMPSTM
jgi:hypothetical protein